MYHLDDVNICYTKQNSKKNYNQKLRNLQLFHNHGIKNVVYVSRDTYDESERYRIENMIEVIELMDDWNAISIEPMNLFLLMPFLKYVSIIIFQRNLFEVQYNELLQFCKQNNIVTVFDIDDYVFNQYDAELVFKSTGLATEEYWEKTTKAHSLMGQACDAYLTTNQFLANKMMYTFEGDIWIISNFFNSYQSKVSEIYLKQKKNRESYVDTFTLGYFSGTNSHYKDFCQIADEVAVFMDRHTNVKLKVVGYMDIPDILDKYLRQGRIIRMPFMDCCALQKEIAEVDVNLIPLEINDFTNCKSEIKYFEAAIVGTISCMTPTYVYSELKKRGVKGYYCKKGEWLNTLENLYCNRAMLYNNFERLHEEAYKYYSFLNQRNKLIDILSGLRNITK